MTPNELRIGNYVFDSIGNEFMIITGLSDTRIEADFIAGPSDERNERFAKGGKFQIVPIPLTPEILKKKCGFEYDNNYYEKDNLAMSLYLSDSFIATSLWVPYEFEIETKLKYLHQLQNLYFALTGEELEVKW